MRKIILALLTCSCFAQDVTAQPRSRNREAQTQQAQASPSPIPVDNRQAEIDNAAEAERERYEKERDAKEDAAREDQARQNRIITAATVVMAGAAVLSLIVGIVYAFFAWRTLKAVDKQANHASDQVNKMGATLEAMDREQEVLRDQATVMREAFRHEQRQALEDAIDRVKQLHIMDRQALISETQMNIGIEVAKITEKQLEATQGQLSAMQRQIELTALSESAYLSVGDLEIPPIRNYELVVNGKIFNRGNTPAFDLQRLIQIAIGEGTPPVGWGRFDWKFNSEECENLLLLKDESVKFTTGPLKIDNALLAEINEGKKTIVVDGQCRYRDSLGDLLVYVFGLTVSIDPPRGHIRYQNHRREKANSN